MKRLRRWLFNFAAAVLLVMSVATIVLRTGYYSDLAGAQFFAGNYQVDLQSFQGSGFITRSDIADPSGATTRPWLTVPSYWHSFFPQHRDPYGLLATEHHRFGFGYGYGLAELSALEKQSGQIYGQLHPRTQSLAMLRNSREKFHPKLIQFPLWFIAMLFGILPVWQLLRYVGQRRRRVKGFCGVCGYDLRATPERCPECGTIPTAAKGVAT